MSWGNEGKCISEFWSHAPRPYQTISTFTWLDMVPPQPANSSTTVSIFECGWQDSCLAVSWHTIPYFLAPWWGLWALILQYVTVLDAYILHAMYYACIANSTWSWDHGRSVLVFVHRHPFTKPAKLPARQCTSRLMPRGLRYPWTSTAWWVTWRNDGGAMEGNQGRFLGAWIENSRIGWIELDKVWEDDVARVIGDISYFNYIYIYINIYI